MARKGGNAIGVPQGKVSKRRNRTCAPQTIFGDSRRALALQLTAQRKPAMRTAADFNLYYAAPDPWHISHARFRDKVLRRCLKRIIRNKSVLELGCGEGHLTHAIFGKARSVVGIDISDVAIARAKSLNLPNARFESADFLQASFRGLRRDRSHRMRLLSVPGGTGSVFGESCQRTRWQNTFAFGSNRGLQKTLRS